MKTGRKILLILAYLFLLSGCSKDDPQAPVQAVEQNNTVEKEQNLAPKAPSNPIPENGSTTADFFDVILSWEASDPDKDKLTYDLFFGPGASELVLVAQDLSTAEYMLDLIDTGQNYVWKVIAKDQGGLQTESPLFFFTTYQKIITGDVLLLTQQEVNDFGAEGYNKIEGDLIIGNKDNSVNISDLRPLHNLNKLQGDLEITQTELADLNGLSHLTSISKGLKILINPMLQSLEGLNQLQTTGGRLVIEGNAFLADISALVDLEKIESDLVITGNPSLQSLKGLNNISMTGLDLVISYNTTLRNLEALESLKEVGETLRIESNALLVSLEGLSSLTAVDLINISENNNLTNLTGLNRINSVSRLVVQGNINLIGLEGLDGLTSVEGQCLINFNPSLISVKGLQNLKAVKGDLVISRSSKLKTVDGLENLNSVGKDMIMQENFDLVNIKGLSNLQNVGGVFALEDNFMLTQLLGLEKLINVGSDMIFETNTRLNDYCSIKNLFDNGKINGAFVTTGNLYNPTEKEMREGICTQN